MKNKKYIKAIMFILVMIISNILVFMYCNLEDKDLTFRYKLMSNKENSHQLYYGSDSFWSEEKSETIFYKNVNEQKNMRYEIPKNELDLRLMLGSEASESRISDMELSYLGKNVKLDINQLLDKNNQSKIEKIEVDGNSVEISTLGKGACILYRVDPDILSDFNQYNTWLNDLLKFIICIFIDISVVVVIKKSRSVLSLWEELKSSKNLIWNLSKNDFKTKYAGSYLGIIWAFIQPIVTILVYWFVFGFGLKSGSPLAGVPFIVWFMAGLVPWFFFQEALINATNCMIEYSYLVKKVLFKISILPIVKIISALFVHLVFIGFLFVVSAIYGFYPSFYTLQLIYYSFCTFFMALALSYATSAIILFFKDLGQIINIFLQIGMWMTPIMWSYTIVPKYLQWIVKLNPMYYIVEGYRDTFINHVWFYERYFQTVYFWIITLGLFVVGAMIFKKLKPHFADVL